MDCKYRKVIENLIVEIELLTALGPDNNRHELNCQARTGLKCNCWSNLREKTLYEAYKLLDEV